MMMMMMMLPRRLRGKQTLWAIYTRAAVCLPLAKVGFYSLSQSYPSNGVRLLFRGTLLIQTCCPSFATLTDPVALCPEVPELPIDARSRLSDKDVRCLGRFCVGLAEDA
jgi:hypothetical protein